jgi:hypothetical protein
MNTQMDLHQPILTDRRHSRCRRTIPVALLLGAMCLVSLLAVSGVHGSEEVPPPHPPLPATYYGEVLAVPSFAPTAGMTVTAWIDGKPCGRAWTKEIDDRVVYVINVLGDDGGRGAGCGVPGGTVSVTFQVDSTLMMPGLQCETQWDNSQLHGVDLGPHISVGEITAPADPVQIDKTEINVGAVFTDPCALGTHTADWDWGDNSMSPGTVVEADGFGSVTGTHVYTAAGVYTVKLTVADDDEDSAQSAFRYVVVYDPEGGFVTGGGWIDSPAGAYAPDPSLAGKATFGFVSKYGAYRPDGVPVQGR